MSLPKNCDWPTLYRQTGTDLTDHYIDVLRALGKQPGLLGDIFAGAQSRFNKPVNLKRMIPLIDETEWTGFDVDVKAQAFEGLLEKAASEGKKGAGQYFTPRVLIQSVVRCMKPDPRANKNSRSAIQLVAPVVSWSQLTNGLSKKLVEFWSATLQNALGRRRTSDRTRYDSPSVGVNESLSSWSRT